MNNQLKIPVESYLSELKNDDVKAFEEVTLEHKGLKPFNEFLIVVNIMALNYCTYEYYGVVPANCKLRVILPRKTETIQSGPFKYTVSLNNKE